MAGKRRHAPREHAEPPAAVTTFIGRHGNEFTLSGLRLQDHGLSAANEKETEDRAERKARLSPSPAARARRGRRSRATSAIRPSARVAISPV
jgi:hypothetical protein